MHRQWHVKCRISVMLCAKAVVCYVHRQTETVACYVQVTCTVKNKLSNRRYIIVKLIHQSALLGKTHIYILSTAVLKTDRLLRVYFEWYTLVIVYTCNPLTENECRLMRDVRYGRMDGWMVCRRGGAQSEVKPS